MFRHRFIIHVFEDITNRLSPIIFDSLSDISFLFSLFSLISLEIVLYCYSDRFFCFGIRRVWFCICVGAEKKFWLLVAVDF